MLKNRIYYQIKPYLPWHIRIGLRRFFARRTLRACKDVWPINRIAAEPPKNWPGWPNGKKFALAITHDVEGARGFDKVDQLVALEMKLGFRSLFNLIPEGEVNIPPEMRAELVRKGFEVGVHDLHHDGKLFENRTVFAQKAKRINSYLSEWGSNGFRAGFMFHNLDWIHDLEILYDSSTFDTDPFEPQPDGVNTIFPFWVAGTTGRGYVELPYTLPQDSTLFLLLKESSPGIWKRKLDWIAEHGGMALLNVHPDYIDFDGSANRNATYPHTHYQEFLEYVHEKYANLCWHALPREIAEFCSVVRPIRRTGHSRRTCMVTHSIYESDTRVMRYAEALAERGDVVDVVCVNGGPHQPDVETINQVEVHRLQRRFRKKTKGQAGYLLPLLRFWIHSSVWLMSKHLKHRYDLIHIHNVPDFLVFAAWFPKLTGAKLILDIHDIVPEFYASKFAKPEDASIIWWLKWMERRSARYADHVIMANHLWLDTYTRRTGTNGKCTVFINYVDTNIFRPRSRTRNDGKLIILFPGGLQRHQGLDVAIRAMPAINAEIPNAELHIYGDGDVKDSLVALAQELGLNGHVRFFNPVAVHQIVQIMANADLGIVPKRADSFGNEAYSTKIMEFMSLGIPVVVSSTKIDRYYFDDMVVRFFESGNPQALADATLEVVHRKELGDQLVQNGLHYAAANSWDTKKAEYLELVDSLTAK